MDDLNIYLIMDDDAMHGLYPARSSEVAISHAFNALMARGYFEEGDAGPLVAIDVRDLDEEDLDAVLEEYDDEAAAQVRRELCLDEVAA